MKMRLYPRFYEVLYAGRGFCGDISYCSGSKDLGLFFREPSVLCWKVNLLLSPFHAVCQEMWLLASHWWATLGYKIAILSQNTVKPNVDV